MAEREKVIAALEWCIEKPCNPKCPYFTQEDKTQAYCLFKKILPDTLALLREQEPRILSLGEAIEGKNGLEIDPYVFVEIKGREDIFIGSVSDISHYNYPDLSFRVGESFQINRNFPGKIYLNTDYMKTVRCWTHKPSIEQRKAVKWDA